MYGRTCFSLTHGVNKANIPMNKTAGMAPERPEKGDFVPVVNWGSFFDTGCEVFNFNTWLTGGKQCGRSVVNIPI